MGGIASVGAYADPSRHLQDLLVRLDLLLRRELTARGPRPAPDYLNFAAITDEEIQGLLNEPRPAGLTAATSPQIAAIDHAIGRLERQIARRVERTRAVGGRLPVIELAARFALSPLELDILTLCLAAELDRRYERIYGYLQDDMGRKLPSLGLALSVCTPATQSGLTARAILGPQAPLRHFRLLEVIDDGVPAPWLAQALRIDERTLAFLLGDTAPDARLAGVIRPLTGAAAAGRRRAADLECLLGHVSHWVAGEAPRHRPLVYLYGHPGCDPEGLADAAARTLGLPVLLVEMESFAASRLEFGEALPLLFRESLLNQAALFLRNADRVLDEDPGGVRVRALLRCATEMGSLLFISGQGPWRWPLPSAPLVLRSLELRPEGFTEQLEIWRGLVTPEQIGDRALERLVSRHPLPFGGIADCWRMACDLAALRSADGTVAIGDLEQACRVAAPPPASGLTRLIEPRHGWQDIVLPAPQLEQLRAICSQATHAATVYGAWGFERKLSLGKGLSALFGGPPGTGKTMAAEVIAADLDLPLLKIDLSQVVSKYIGETEKNLRGLFDQAAAAHAILFFDEADALLGKRSAVGDAHDRYANTEVAYLLQKMEEFEGITILATNLRQNMDEAFTRRLRFVVDFPFPEEDDRLRIWHGVWPPEVPRANGLDLGRVARQFRLSGGSIRNIALAAAFLAAAQRQPVTMGHLLHAVRRELQKMGRLVNEAEVQP